MFQVILEHDLEVLGLVRVDAVAGGEDEALVDDGATADPVAEDPVHDPYLPLEGLAFGVGAAKAQQEREELSNKKNNYYT